MSMTTLAAWVAGIALYPPGDGFPAVHGQAVSWSATALPKAQACMRDAQEVGLGSGPVLSSDVLQHGYHTIPLLWLTRLRCTCRQDVQGNMSQEASTSAPDSWLVFEVTDTGCGIAKEGLHALFNDYVQASR